MPEVAWSLRRQLASRLRLKKAEDKPPRRIHVKLSVTETDFVVLEDVMSLDSSAVVLKSTLILTFKSIPDREKELNCSIEGLELFSCNLSNEDETALSILDPVSIAIEIKPPESLFDPNRDHHLDQVVMPQILEIEVKQLNFRLSYNDIKLFLAIAQSLPSLGRNESKENFSKEGSKKPVDDLLVKRLVPLGFTKSDIRKELYRSSEVAPFVLLDSNKGIESLSEELERESNHSGETKGEEGEKRAFSIKSIQVNVGSVSVCLIDDCVDHDVPLLDFSLADFQAEHSISQIKEGKARALFAGDYYNRHISAWEPVLEPWKCELSWKMMAQFSTDLDSSKSLDRTCLAVMSKEQLNLNLTSSLLHILHATQESWSRDLQQQNRHSPQGPSSSATQSSSVTPSTLLKAHQRTPSGRVLLEEREEGEDGKGVSTMEKGLALLHSVRFVSVTRQRAKFVPFLLRNNTGLPLKFATLTSVPSKVYVSPYALYQKTMGIGGGGGGGVVESTPKWMDVSSGGEQPFDFSTQGKMRHRDTRDLVVHQLLVKVAGWQSINIPVSVDQIGIFFREVLPSSETDLDLVAELPMNRGPVRLVFAISLSDEVQKVVNVRSALVLSNTMEIPLEVKLEPKSDAATSSSVNPVSNFGTKSVNLPVLAAKGFLAIPIHLTAWNIFVRPQHWGVQYCNKHLAWRHVTGTTPTSHTRSCDAIGEDVAGDPPLFRFCVSVQRENFPIATDSASSAASQPAHTLFLLPPLTVTNLLPCDIQFSVLESRAVWNELRQRRLVPKGESITVYSVDSLSLVEFDIAVENFERCQGGVVSLDRVGIPQSMVMEDYNGRPLRLNLTSECIGGSALKVSISCAFWLVNRTGLPLVFRQEGMNSDAAGQQEEHEKASTTTPLLFSYSEGEFVEKCSMRLGRNYRYLNGRPMWCTPFRMIRDCGVCRVFVRSKDDRPNQEFQIGVDVQRGSGKYRRTKIVTFVAHYQLVNRTEYKLAYLQRHQLHEEDRAHMSEKTPTIMPGALLPFHWPRTDLDQLLSIRIVDIPDSSWSGGFMLDKDSNFHVNIRSLSSNYSAFVRCQVTLKGATFHVIFSDAAKYPPPFRLENLSLTPITCFQQGVQSCLAMLLNPGQSVPYSWDEHTLPETLCIAVKGDKELSVDLETFGPKGKVYYESYFYIMASGTFPAEEYTSFHAYPAVGSAHHRTAENLELVLDVPQGRAVIFQKKDPNKRTQLWRMSASRQLVHIASSTSGARSVLDITGGRLPGVGQFESLVVQRSSTARAQSQSWRFCESGRLLMDKAPHLCVQSRTGYESLREGADAVLGCVTGGRDSVPQEQKVQRRKHSPGSGVLSAAVVPDGPTRILRVVDENRKYSHTRPRDDWPENAPSRTSDVDNYQDSDTEEGVEPVTMEFEVSLVLQEGVGVSLINAVPEELIFATFKGIKVEFLSCKENQVLSANIQYIQVDNKLAGCHTPVLAYPTPPPSGEAEPTYPVLILLVEKIPYQSPSALVFKVVQLKLQDMTVIVGERLLFKLLQWAGIGRSSPRTNPNKQDEIVHMLSYRTAVSSGQHQDSMQLYCEQLNIATTEMRMSVTTTSQLPDDLRAIKQNLGIPLVKFQSPVKLKGYRGSHLLGGVNVYADNLFKHYRRVITAQALKILGSMDFLGNPMGLVSDVASGVSGMVSVQPDVVGLVRDVAHGMSDTTSKLTGTVSHVLGKATFDSSYQEEREQMLESCQTSKDHLKAGLMGLSSGVFGGMTSIVTQPIKDAKSYGFGGLLTGLAKGVVGTVAKPVAGLFDLASETTAAIRETTSRVSRQLPPPVRHTRCCLGANGALTPYSVSQARGREYLLRLTDGKLSEKLVSYELLYENQSSKERMRVIISSQYLYFFQQSPPDPNSLDNRISLDELAECKPVTAKSSIPIVYIVLSLINKQLSYNAPKYKCSDERTATKVAQLINYAKNLHEEEKHVVRTFRLQEGATLW